MPQRVRIDRLLVDRGLVESREQAARRIMAGEVLGRRPARGQGRARWWRRRRHRAARPAALREPGGREAGPRPRHFGVEVTGQVCLDVGASTGGFTDCLLQRGRSPRLRGRRRDGPARRAPAGRPARRRHGEHQRADPRSPALRRAAVAGGHRRGVHLAGEGPARGLRGARLARARPSPWSSPSSRSGAAPSARAGSCATPPSTGRWSRAWPATPSFAAGTCSG